MDIRVRSCPVCNSRETAEFLLKGTLRLVQCRRCSMIYADPVPAEMRSGEFYREAASYYLSPEKLESDYSKVRFARELRIFRKHCKSGAVLDVGCSSGGFLFQLNQGSPGCYQVLGTDVSTPSLHHAASRGISIIEGDFPKHDFGSQRFDAITFWAVMEHLAAPKAFIGKASKLLKPGGLCFILVPNMRSLAVRLIGGRYRYIFPEHINYFTRTSLTALVQDNFEPVQVYHTHFNPVVIWQDRRNRGDFVSQDKRGELLKKTTALKTNRLFVPLQVLYKCAESILGATGMTDNLVLVLRKREARGGEGALPFS